MKGSGTSGWIEDGEKYALVGLSVKFEGYLPAGLVSANLSALADTKFTVPAEWREWLGSIRTGDVEDNNLFLFSNSNRRRRAYWMPKTRSSSSVSGISTSVCCWRTPFAPAHKPVMLTGSRQETEIGLRQQQDFDCPVPCLFRPYPAVTPDDVKLAGSVSAKIWRPSLEHRSRAVIGACSVPSMSISRRAARRILLSRIHQYCRCIDGLIVPDVGKTIQQFKSRTELFIGPGHHDLMGELYDIRSAAEHLHENRYLEYFDRSVRLELARKEAIAEHIARSALFRVIGNDAL